VAVGIGTALADDPLLTARDVDLPFSPPRRVVFDSAARLPPAGALARDARSGPPVLVVAAADAPTGRVAALEAAGVEVLRLPGDPAARLAAALDALGAREVQSLLVEGGASLAGALVAAGLVDRVAWFLAPLLIGGRGAPSALGDPGATALAEAPRLRDVEVARSGPDTLVTGRLRPPAWEG
jgi:diaminohydroxyphosphoribosylaminopyrimidine deaminase/5-amino-6-(5-phosphoribosylamino)uracil reductase